MKEIREIIKAYDEAQKLGKQTALATVVHVDGSSYRRPGARMLITENGELTGAISGGCLEGDALRKALLVMVQQKSMLVTYDTMDEDDAKLGIGLGCNGIIQVLIEPINVDDTSNPIQLLKIIAAQREIAVLVTLFSLENKKDKQYGTCLLLKDDHTTYGDAPIMKDILTINAKDVLANQNSLFKNYTSEAQSLTAFIELIKPAIALIIIGAGNDVMPLVAMAEVLGWEITIIDGRSNYAKQERFVYACQVLVSKPENVFEKIKIDEQTAFLLMTHNYNYDMAMLRQLAEKNIKYIGMLGPKKKLERMLGELKDEGKQLNDDQLSIVHSPVGLDIGAETSEEIALSILAEIKAVFASRPGQPLRNKNEVIHPRGEAAMKHTKIASTK